MALTAKQARDKAMDIFNDKEQLAKVIEYVHEFKNHERDEKRCKDDKTAVVKAAQESMGVPASVFKAVVSQVAKSKDSRESEEASRSTIDDIADEYQKKYNIAG